MVLGLWGDRLPPGERIIEGGRASCQSAGLYGSPIAGVVLIAEPVGPLSFCHRPSEAERATCPDLSLLALLNRAGPAENHPRGKIQPRPGGLASLGVHIEPVDHCLKLRGELELAHGAGGEQVSGLHGAGGLWGHLWPP